LETISKTPEENKKAMTKFNVEVEWSGYSRGTALWEVEAESEEDARENYYEGKRIQREIVRDDTEEEILSIAKIYK